MDRLTLFFLASAQRTYDRLTQFDAAAWGTGELSDGHHGLMMHQHVVHTCERLAQDTATTK
jgi:hypothetical protein